MGKSVKPIIIGAVVGAVRGFLRRYYRSHTHPIIEVVPENRTGG